LILLPGAVGQTRAWDFHKLSRDLYLRCKIFCKQNNQAKNPSFQIITYSPFAIVFALYLYPT